MAGTLGLLVAKCLENMELGHNITHGQWDWMNDPEIHSNTWEWDMVGPSSQWRYAHNYRHHVFSNVIGMDDDLGFGVIRVAVTRNGSRVTCGLRCGRSGCRSSSSGESRCTTWPQNSGISRPRRQRPSSSVPCSASWVARQPRTISSSRRSADVAFCGHSWRTCVAAGFRNGWAYIVIVCGHFVDGAEKFTPAAIENETKPEWYLRQMLGTANFNAGPVLRLMSGNLCYQIEHHLFPDLPSNRHPEISARVQAILAEYDLPYTTGPLIRQFWDTVRTICKLSLPNRFLTATSDDAPETASEEKFRDVPMLPRYAAAHDVGTRRRGLVTAIADRAGQRVKPGRRRSTFAGANRRHGRACQLGYATFFLMGACIAVAIGAPLPD